MNLYATWRDAASRYLQELITVEQAIRLGDEDSLGDPSALYPGDIPGEETRARQRKVLLLLCKRKKGNTAKKGEKAMRKEGEAHL